MQTAQTDQKLAGEVLIFERLLRNGSGAMPPELARYLLALGFSDQDKARMHELAARNQQGAATPVEVESC
jgi:hypothetical protein